MADRNIDPKTLRALATRLSREAKIWTERAAETQSDTYGEGFKHGMAEMARRVVRDCRAHALGLEKHARAIEKRKAKR